MALSASGTVVIPWPAGFTDVFFTFLCSDSQTIAGLPGPIHEGLSILKKVIVAIFCFSLLCYLFDSTQVCHPLLSRVNATSKNQRFVSAFDDLDPRPSPLCDVICPCKKSAGKPDTTVAQKCHGTNKNFTAQTKTSRHKQKFSRHKRKLSRHKQKLSRHKQKLSRHKRKLSRHKQKLSRHKQKLTAQTKTLTAQTKTLTAQTKTLTAQTKTSRHKQKL